MVLYKHSELFDENTYTLYNRPDLPTIYCDMVGCKCGKFTTKQQPNKKSKKLLVEIIDEQKEIIVKLIKILVKL